MSKKKDKDTKKNLKFSTKNIWESTNKKQMNLIYEFCEGYKKFLDIAKTEREFVDATEELVKENGFENIDKIIKNNKQLKNGMKIYKVVKNKTIILAVIGEKSLEKGVNIIGSHIDSPRIDLKQNPLYQDTDIALFKTHYYGGIKKYQWTTIPLALHGVFVKEDGEVIKVKIGEDESEPIFCITDLLPHLAQDQMNQKLGEGIKGEALNVLVGTVSPGEEEEKEKVKKNILNILNNKYGIIEEDFISAEIEVVPAFKARDVGLDASLVGAYGQDDRVCSYVALKSLLDIDKIEKTAICFLTDKEEIGSVGNTGAKSSAFENFLSELCLAEKNDHNIMTVKRCLENSEMISGDVNPAVDPTYPEVQEKRNASYLGKGLVISKYTGVRGKLGASDANPEFVAKIRKIFNNGDIRWQAAEIGKVDQGGGGTIAQFFANLGMEVLDCGISILSMHSPFEITSKADIYEMYNGFKFFYEQQN